MQHLFSIDGDKALAAVLQLRPLLAFDFDGTLAPIVALPHTARVPPAVVARLAMLAARLPVAIVTGRSVADVRDRLGFEPHTIVGNHGAEDAADPAAAAAHLHALDPLRQALMASGPVLAAAGILVEDKGQSIALHYRLSRLRERAPALIRDVLAPIHAPFDASAGKMVINLTVPGAPDKAHAVRTLLKRSGNSCAVFVGDDFNDEPVFIAAPPNWLTVRVGRGDAASRALFYIDSPEQMGTLLDRMLVRLPSPEAA